ncbi:hypothetical protein NIES4071_25350 [Calothrix sp. NIES-4071]|nr:hypothetical protein NIES4071_25350 [Calothrix sp. NIES-4071]BAZ56858.1 hypothetical protein NIES4105_25290 [Calothrix sp. NIES-4105]
MRIFSSISHDIFMLIIINILSLGKSGLQLLAVIVNIELNINMWSNGINFNNESYINR